MREVHPFTTITNLASEKAFLKNGQDSIQVQFIFRPSAPTSDYAMQPLKGIKQWTNKLVSLLDEESRGQSSSETVGEIEAATARIRDPDALNGRSKRTSVQLSLRLEGPYFTPALPSRYETVVCLVSGTGLSGAIAIAAAFESDQRAKVPALHCGGRSGRPAQPSATPDTLSRWQRCIVLWTVREKEQAHMPYFEGETFLLQFWKVTHGLTFASALECKGLTFQTHLTGGSRARLDIPKTLLENIGESGRDCWCYISGSNGFIDSAERACRQVSHLTTFAARQAS